MENTLIISINKQYFLKTIQLINFLYPFNKTDIILFYINFTNKKLYFTNKTESYEICVNINFNIKKKIINLKYISFAVNYHFIKLIQLIELDNQQEIQLQLFLIDNKLKKINIISNQSNSNFSFFIINSNNFKNNSLNQNIKKHIKFNKNIINQGFNQLKSLTKKNILYLTVQNKYLTFFSFNEIQFNIKNFFLNNNTHTDFKCYFNTITIRILTYYINHFLQDEDEINFMVDNTNFIYLQNNLANHLNIIIKIHKNLLKFPNYNEILKNFEFNYAVQLPTNKFKKILKRAMLTSQNRDITKYAIKIHLLKNNINIKSVGNYNTINEKYIIQRHFYINNVSPSNQKIIKLSKYNDNLNKELVINSKIIYDYISNIIDTNFYLLINTNKNNEHPVLFINNMNCEFNILIMLFANNI